MLFRSVVRDLALRYFPVCDYPLMNVEHAKRESLCGMAYSNSLMIHRDIHEDCNWIRFYETPYRSNRRVMFNIPYTLEFTELFEVIATARLRMHEGKRGDIIKSAMFATRGFAWGSHRPPHALSAPMARTVSIRAGCGSGRLLVPSHRAGRGDRHPRLPHERLGGLAVWVSRDGRSRGVWHPDFP